MLVKRVELGDTGTGARIQEAASEPLCSRVLLRFLQSPLPAVPSLAEEVRLSLGSVLKKEGLSPDCPPPGVSRVQVANPGCSCAPMAAAPAELHPPLP